MLKVGDCFCVGRRNRSCLPPAMEMSRIFRVKKVGEDPITEETYYEFEVDGDKWRVYHGDVHKMGI